VRVRVLLACALSLACSKHAPLSQACVPGRSVACVGPGGCAGGQVCTPAGDSYGPCVCPPAVIDAGELAADLAPPAPDVPPLAPDAAPLDLALDVAASIDVSLSDAAVDLAPLPPPIFGVPLECVALGIHSLDEVDSKFIAPRCGAAGCHQAIFPPRNLNNVAMIRGSVVGRKAQILCKTESYIDTSDYTKSFMLTKVTALGDSVACASGGAADSGGSRMPNKTWRPGRTCGRAPARQRARLLHLVGFHARQCRVRPSLRPLR
jgi:hypothetical protein